MSGSEQRGFPRDDGFRARPEERRLERACEIIALFVSVAFAAAAFWELGDSFSAGHYAASSAVCTGAENMWQWGILAPVAHHTLRPPVPSEYYCHHPFGIFWVTALFMKALGHQAWACRLPAAIQSALTPAVLYLAARALWGPVAGVVAAASYAVVPIALSFADMNALEVPVIFATVVAIWGYARFRQTYARRFLALGLGGLLYAVCCDWAAVIFAAVMLGAVFASVFLLRRWTLIADRRRIAGFWGLAVALCAIAIAAHLYTFQHFGQLNELFAQGTLRSAGVEQPLSHVLFARKFWIEVSFTELAIALGKLALPVLALRVVARRSELEALPLAVFAMALLQYVVFKQGADIHIFWPFYFAEYFALAFAGLVQSVLELLQRVTRIFPRTAGAWPNYACLGLGLLVPFAILPDGLRALHYGHRSGGRFNENGHPTKPDKEKVAVLEWLTRRMAPNTGVTLHPGMRQSLWVDWTMRRPAATVSHPPSTPATGQDRYYVADMRFMTATEQEALVQNFSVTALDTFLTVDRAAPKGEFQVLDVQRYEPSWLEKYWVSSTHALRRVVPNPFVTWELRDRFELSPNDPPARAPVSFEEIRIAHNIAVARSDEAGAARGLTALLAGCDHSASRTFADGDQLLGTRLERGTSLVYSVYLLAAGPDASEPALVMHSIVESAPASSLVGKDTAVADVGVPFGIPTSRWKRGYVYVSLTEVIRRIGRERWYGSFHSARESGSPSSDAAFPMLTLE
jgi:hypothetical protein